MRFDASLCLVTPSRIIRSSRATVIVLCPILTPALWCRDVTVLEDPGWLSIMVDLELLCHLEAKHAIPQGKL
ncbi:hypothetical protein F5884DRAFT_780918 [Xylogone sp. PMI_703]|nr:hypothetical protein F5884DRAFT_780918 [Xylogone sp. PMI_703]